MNTPLPSGARTPSSLADFLNFGVGEIAYLRQIDHQGGRAVGIFAADGTPLAIAATHDLARAAVIQHELEPASVH